MDDRLPEDPTPSSIESRVELKCARLFVQYASGNAISFLLGAMMIAYVLYTSHVLPLLIIVWLLACLALVTAILLFQRKMAKIPLNFGNMDMIVNIRMALGTAVGILYGIAPYTLPGNDTLLQDTFLFIILSSFVAIAMLGYSVMPRYFKLLNYTVMGLLTLHFLINYFNNQNTYYLLLLASSLLWQFIFMLKSMQVSRNIMDGLTLHERLHDETIVKQEAQHLAMHDELTGLPNRRYFGEMSSHILHVAARRSTRMGIVLIDLNGFKAINDKYGHTAGDLVLRKFGNHLLENIRESDFAARLGGDEFIVLIDNPENAGALENIMEKLHKDINMQLEEKQLSLIIRSSAGHAIYPDDGTSLQQLLNIADQRMYQQKHAGAIASGQQMQP